VKTKRIIVAAAAAAAVVGGSAGAIAATKQDEGKKAEQAVLDDAAKRLNVAPTELRDALAKAQDAQLDQAVKDGRLTQQQADAIKARRKENGRVLGGGRGHHGPGHHGLRAGGLLKPAADALGLTRRELATQLRAGKTLAEIAKAENKDLSDVKSAVKKAATERLEAAVKAGRLTDAQRDAKVAELDEHIDRFATGEGPGRFGHRGGRGHFGPPPGAPEAPDEDPSNG